MHTTSAYRSKGILRAGALEPQPCDVFKGENLTYFFYGRPSYKRESKNQISKYWELPVVFIMNYSSVKIRRIYPFDTGAFLRNYYPDFIGMTPLQEFELDSTIDAPQRLVGSFFVNAERYFRLKPRMKNDFLNRFQVDVMEEEVRALHDLTAHFDEKIDDRRFSIEIQTAESTDLGGQVMAVVFPEEYAESDEFVDMVYKLGAEPLIYPSYPLKQEMYYHTIYNIVFEFYRSKGLVR